MALGGAAPAAAAGGTTPPSSSSSSASVVKQKFTVTDDIIRQIKNSRRSRHSSASSWSPRAWQTGMGSSRGAIMDTEGLVNAYVELVCEDLKTGGK